MQKKPTTQRGRGPERTETDAETEQAMLALWQRRAHAFAWACGMRVDHDRVRDDE